MKLKTSQRQMSESLWTIAFLTLSGGLQDAYSYFVRGKVFANAQTGNLVFMAASLFEGDWQTFIHYLIPVLFFAGGVYFAARARYFLSRYQKIHWRQWILLMEIVLLCLVPWIRENIIANSIISFCCAMQVQSFRKFRGQPFNSTMCVANSRGAMELWPCSDSLMIRPAAKSFSTMAWCCSSSAWERASGLFSPGFWACRPSG